MELDEHIKIVEKQLKVLNLIKEVAKKHSKIFPRVSVTYYSYDQKEIKLFLQKPIRDYVLLYSYYRQNPNFKIHKTGEWITSSTAFLTAERMILSAYFKVLRYNRQVIVRRNLNLDKFLPEGIPPSKRKVFVKEYLREND
ncbi:MAG: hypothetical protein ACTSYD_02380 [Candidatus Heimdallarchaeaceae archaeon]